MVARTHVPLQPGALAFFKVEQVAPQCILKLVELKYGQQSELCDLLLKGSGCRVFPYKSLVDVLEPLMVPSGGPNQLKLPNILEQMWTIVSSVSIRPNGTVRPELLKAFIGSSGMMWERKLKSLLLSGLQPLDRSENLVQQDLKGLALQSLADTSVTKLLSTGGVNSFIDTLEQLQLLNVFGLEEKGKLLFSIPIYWHDSFRFVRLLIDLAGNRDGASEDDQNGVVKLTLFLDMSHLGPVRVDALVFQKVIRVNFSISDEEVRALFYAYTDSLKEQLERHGFSIQQIVCRLEEESNLASTSLVEDIMDQKDGNVNLVI